MKTAISVPDATFERAERVAKKHGLNRSQFYAAAAERYSAELEAADLTAAIDEAIAASTGAEPADGSAEFAILAGRRTLDRDDDEW